MADSFDKGVIEEAAQEASSLGSNVAKTVAEETIKIATGVGGTLLGKKPKTKEELEFEIAKKKKEEEDSKMLRKKQMELRMLRESQRRKEKMLEQKQADEEKALPKPAQIKQLERAKITPPAISKTRTELKGGWGAG